MRCDTLVTVMVEGHGAGVEEGTLCEAVQMGLTSVSTACLLQVRNASPLK